MFESERASKLHTGPRAKAEPLCSSAEARTSSHRDGASSAAARGIQGGAGLGRVTKAGLGKEDGRSGETGMGTST